LNNGLMLFDHEQQFLLRSDDGQAFTHKTAHLSTLSSYPATLDKSPLYIGYNATHTLLYTNRRAQYHWK
jgi:hypothetical protein